MTGRCLRARCDICGLGQCTKVQRVRLLRDPGGGGGGGGGGVWGEHRGSRFLRSARSCRGPHRGVSRSLPTPFSPRYAIPFQAGWTPLLRAANSGHAAVAEKLLGASTPASLAWVNKVCCGAPGPPPHPLCTPSPASCVEPHASSGCRCMAGSAGYDVGGSGRRSARGYAGVGGGWCGLQEEGSHEGQQPRHDQCGFASCVVCRALCAPKV